MNRWTAIAAGAAALIAWRYAPAPDVPPSPAPPAQNGAATPLPQGETHGRVIEGRSVYKFACYLPEGYGREPVFYPLILFLHGQRTDDNPNVLSWFGPVKYALTREGFPFIVAAPSSGEGWNVLKLKAFLDGFEARHPVDTDRVYLTGFSMGGHATWKLAAAYPNRFAAVAPVCGAGNPRDARRGLRRLPAWVFHGMLDDGVPAKYGMQMVGALRAAGADVRYTLYPDLGHNSWDAAYGTPELYEWFLQHGRKTNREKRMAEAAEATPAPKRPARQRPGRESF